MPFKIVRNDIFKMKTVAVVRVEKSESAKDEVFITSESRIKNKYIIHAIYIKHDDDEKLRNCYRNCLSLAKQNQIRSLAFPLITTGSQKFPKEEGLRIAIDEIQEFLHNNDMEIYLVLDKKSSLKDNKKLSELNKYIDRKYEKKRLWAGRAAFKLNGNMSMPYMETAQMEDMRYSKELEDRIRHISDTFSQYLLYLIQSKNMENADVWKRGIVDKKVFSKIKNNPDYHPQKLTVLCLCMGAKLNLDETKDLLARAGYALSPCDKTDIIFSYFIENEIYDMIELDIQLEEHGLPCIIT